MNLSGKITLDEITGKVNSDGLWSKVGGYR